MERWRRGRKGGRAAARPSAHRLSRPPARSRQQHGRSETEEYSSDSESESEDEEELQIILEDLQRQNEELEVSTGFQKVSLSSGLPFCGNEREAEERVEGTSHRSRPGAPHSVASAGVLGLWRLPRLPSNRCERSGLSSQR